jgi:hypothetical protein
MRRAIVAAMRLCCALSVLGAALGGLALARGRAEADERVMDLGAHLLSYARGVQLEAPRMLVVNGLQVHVVSGSTRDSVGALLDTFHGRCRDASGGLDRLPDALPGDRRGARIAAHALDPVLRHGDRRGGYVACLDLGRAAVPAQDLLDRVQRFLRSGDLADVGDLRFAWAFAGERSTTWIGLYTRGPVPLPVLFPAQGDAPGMDVTAVPRPAGTRRIVSAFQRDAAPMLASYESRLAPDVALQAYRQQLARGGHVTRVLAASMPALQVGDAEGEPNLLAFASASAQGKTLVTVVRLR